MNSKARIALTLSLLPVAAAPAYAQPRITVSSQVHWAPSESPVLPPPSLIVFDLAKGQLGDSTLAHTHLDLVNCPIYAELTGPVTCRFAVKLFHTTGQAFLNPAYQDGIRDIVFDATGTSTSPDMIGDPMGLKEWDGSLVIDPSLPSQFQTAHGWYVPNFNVVTRYDNGAVVELSLLASFFSNLDPSAPERPGVPIVSARAAPHSTRHPEENWGTNIVETHRQLTQFLPLAPITEPQAMQFSSNGYGADGLPPAVMDQRANIDLHNHDGGIVVQSITQEKVINMNAVFDPAVLGPGQHKMALLRHQIGLSGTEAVNTLLVFDVNVGPTPPPPIVTVPNIVGQTQAAATNLLTAAGLTLGAVTTANSASMPAGIVISQNPAAGASVARGSAVAIVVSRGP